MTRHWETMEVLCPDRTFYHVLCDGWYIADCYNGPDGWRLASRPSEQIPSEILAGLPVGARKALESCGAA